MELEWKIRDDMENLTRLRSWLRQSKCSWSRGDFSSLV